jgi:protein TonB
MKTNPKTNKLEGKRGLFWQIGLALALGAIYFALNYKTYENFELVFKTPEVETDETVIPVTVRPAATAPQPSKPNNNFVMAEPEPEPEPFWKNFDYKFEGNGNLDSINFEDPLPLDEDPNEVFGIFGVENRPIFPGCENEPTEEARFQCFQKSILNYVHGNFKMPRISQQMGSSGKTFVTFIIEKDGQVSNVKVIRGVDEFIDAEAARVVKSLPKFTPAKQTGRPVRTSYVLPLATATR